MLSTLTFDGPIARLTFNRPEVRNALSLDLLESLHSNVDALATRTDVTCCIITGAGKVFCAGMDLKAVLGNAPLSEKLLTDLALLTLKLRKLPCITLAVANGAAIGGGCGLVTVCDLAITHAESKMGFPEVDMGVCPAVVAPWLCKKVGFGKARQILLSGGLMTGREAAAAGLVSQVLESREAMEADAEKIAQRLATAAPHALAATKGLLNELDGSLDEALLRRAALLSASVLNMPASQAMLRAKMGG
jgi:methylglutaconyl-CoA hydratase